MKFKIYFPSKDKNGKQIPSSDHRNTLEWVQRKLIEDFGGFTLYHASGYWKGKDIVIEDVLIFEVFTDEVTETYLRTIASIIKKELNQDSVMFAINNMAYFV